MSRASAFGAGALVLGGALLLVSRGGVSPERPQGPPVALRSVALPTRVVTRPSARLVESGLPIALDAPAVRVASPPVARDALRVPGGPTREFHLRVIGADTGDDLDGVVVHALSRAGRGVRHPGLRDQAPVVARGDSPLLVESDDLDSAWTLPSGRRILLVGAPGYAWSRVPIAHDASGRRQVSLRRQARLAVELRGTLGAVGLELVLRDDTAGEFVFRHPLAADDVGRRFVFDGLPEGSAFTLGVVAPLREEVRVLTSVAVTLDRGRVAEQNLVVHAPWRESAARVEGRLTAPFVEGTELAVTLESRAPSRGLAARRALVAEVQEIERAGAGVTATWSVDSAPPGAYVATVEPFGAMFAIEAHPGDTQRLHLDVPRLAELAVTARDEVSGQVFVPQVLQWQALSAELWKRTAERAFVADADELRSSLHVAPGRLRLQVLSTRGVDGHSHLVGEAVITARPGPQQVEVAVRPVHSLHLSFADAGEAVPFLWPDVLHIDAPPGSGRLNLRWLATHSLVLFETPGSYRFRVEAPVGYERVPQFEINLTPGRNRREVPLVRS